MSGDATHVLLQTNESPEFWTFVVTNLLTLVLGLALTAIAFVAYRREGHRAFLLSTVGFVLITVGTIVEIAYEVGFNDVLYGGISAFGVELFVLRSVEGFFIAAGLLFLLLSIKNV